MRPLHFGHFITGTSWWICNLNQVNITFSVYVPNKMNCFAHAPPYIIKVFYYLMVINF